MSTAAAALNIDASRLPHLRLVPALDNQEIEPARSRGRSQDSAQLLTAEEAAEILLVSPKTLANWRSKGTGPAFIKVGGRVAYRREVVLAFGRESPGFGQQGKPEVKITTRPYAKDPSRQHVDIMFPHPLTPAKMHRTRVVAPVGLGPGAAQEWGKREGQRVMYAMIRGETGKPAAAAPDVPAEREAAPPQKQQTPDDIDTLTLAELWEQFTPGYVDANKYATQQAFKYAWSWLAPILGDKSIDQIDRRSISKLRASMRGKVGPATRNLVVAKLNKALRWAIEEGHMADRNVKVKAEKVPTVHKDVFTPVDVDRMLAQCDTIDDTVLTLLCFHGALRVGETCGLMWKDIDWAAGTMLICRNVHRGRLQPSAKGEDGLVPLSPRLVSALRRLQARSDGDSFVLQRKDGGHTTDFANGKRVIKLQLDAGLPGAGPHMLRHGALTHAANNGASPYSLQAFARHAQMTTTMKYYVHLNSANVARQAVAMFADEPVMPGESGNELATAGNGP